MSMLRRALNQPEFNPISKNGKETRIRRLKKLIPLTKEALAEYQKELEMLEQDKPVAKRKKFVNPYDSKI